MQVAVAAPSAANGAASAPGPAAPAARVQLSEKHRQLLQTHKGPLVKIATHYHVGFGDCLRVIGSSEELGAWKAEGAPLMKWGEGDVWTLVTPLPPGEHAFKVCYRPVWSQCCMTAAGFLHHEHCISCPSNAQVPAEAPTLLPTVLSAPPAPVFGNDTVCRSWCSSAAGTWCGRQETPTGWCLSLRALPSMP